MKRVAIHTIKILVPVAILVWIVSDLHQTDPQAIRRLIERPKDPRLLGASLACVLLAICLSFCRWHLLVRALDIDFHLVDAFKLGFLGYLFNFVGPSAVGGDFFKAFFLARDQQGKRVEVIATIVLDRVVGLYSLLIVASIAILAMDAGKLPELGGFLRLVVWTTVAAGGCTFLLLLPARFTRHFVQPVKRVPFFGSLFGRTVAALGLYRRRMHWLLVIAAISITIHALFALSMHLSDRAIHPKTPRLNEHLIISPLANAAGAAPLPGGLGSYELAMDLLFKKLPAEPTEPGQGLAVALVYRIITIVIASIGAVFFILNRRRVRDVVAEIELERESV